MSNNFFLWNGTSIAHMFIRLITKTNHPYDDNLSLTLEEFNNDYNMLKEFIKWHKNNHKTYLLYNFTQDNMNELINFISYETDNKEHLNKLWLKICNKDDIDVIDDNIA